MQDCTQFQAGGKVSVVFRVWHRLNTSLYLHLHDFWHNLPLPKLQTLLLKLAYNSCTQCTNKRQKWDTGLTCGALLANLYLFMGVRVLLNKYTCLGCTGSPQRAENWACTGLLTIWFNPEPSSEFQSISLYQFHDLRFSEVEVFSRSPTSQT